jgi:tRNA(Ile)-lysidine synthase
MITMSLKLPRTIAVAVSGGVDSVAALHFLSRNHNVTIVHVDHNEGNSDTSAAFVRALAQKYECPIITKRITSTRHAGVSPEEFWRNERYNLFHQIPQTVVTAHTLDDCVETWLWSSLHGNSKLIPFTNDNVVRPFLATRKQDFVEYAKRHQLSWVEDESNNDLSLIRNYIRKELMPHALRVNPGLYKTILKKVKTNV